MSLKSIAQLLPFSRRISSVLVCETDGFTLRGAIVSRSGDGLVVSYSSRSEALEFKDAVAEIVTNVKAQGWQGKTAILLTPGALSTLVDLPVAPNSKRPPEQMLELVRWELEPLLMQHTTLWSVGRILVGLGYLTEAQATEVLDRQQGRKGVEDASALDVYSFKRYGEMAIEMGYITHRQMEECLTRQAWLQGSGDEIACGWSAQPVAKGQTTDEGQYPWLVCGINQGMMQQWSAAFAESHVILQRVYPLVGCAATSFELSASEAGDQLLIEAHAGLVAAIRVVSGSVSAINLQQSTLKNTLDACLEAFHVLTPPDVKAIWLGSAIGESDGLEISLTSMLGRPVNQLSSISSQVTPGMLGAARHLLEMEGAARCCGVSVLGPSVPIWQSVEARAIAAALLLLLGVGAAETILQLRQNLAEQAHEEITAQAAVMDEAVGRVQVQIDAINKLKESLKAKNDEIDLLKTRTDLLAVDAPKRSAFLQALLIELSSVTPDDMVLERIEETPRDGFRFTAWSLSEKSAQQFVKSFQSAMDPYGLKVVEVSVGSQVGRLGLTGYILRLRLDKQPAPTATDVAVGKT
ncbi:hypothetical protein [Methylotenera mobilis]|uniref:hypothetical protein n=1 Tax=Methylotenera mobilis TaxID=359408 RepID=UPI00035C3632|nr:hypothetical protein [Methylotenera mobilis]PPC97352.1 MAG: hypothetical protein CTY32_01855 [Methylotenera sp.]